jgi:hypothetical protein
VTGTCVSSLVIAPVAVPTAIVALIGFEMLTVNVSSCSIAVSPTTETAIDFAVSPGAKVRVPVACV